MLTWEVIEGKRRRYTLDMAVECYHDWENMSGIMHVEECQPMNIGGESGSVHGVF